MLSQQAAANATRHPELEGHVIAMETRGFWRDPQYSPNARQVAAVPSCILARIVVDTAFMFVGVSFLAQRRDVLPYWAGNGKWDAEDDGGTDG